MVLARPGAIPGGVRGGLSVLVGHCDVWARGGRVGVVVGRLGMSFPLYGQVEAVVVGVQETVDLPKGNVQPK